MITPFNLRTKSQMLDLLDLSPPRVAKPVALSKHPAMKQQKHMTSLAFKQTFSKNSRAHQRKRKQQKVAQTLYHTKPLKVAAKQLNKAPQDQL